MNDLISRQAAIDFIDAGRLCSPNEPRWSDNEVVNFLKSRPSAQPRKGKWNYPYETTKMVCHCSLCGGYGKDNMNFCPNCGADMRGEQDDASHPFADDVMMKGEQEGEENEKA